LKKYIFLLMIILLVVIALNVNYIQKPFYSEGRTIYLMVHSGESVGHILDRIDSLNLSLSPIAAKIYLRLYGAEKKIAPGRYKIKAGCSRLDLLTRLRNGEIDFVWITIPEGLTVNKTIETVAQISGRQPLEFLKLVNDADYLSTLPLSPENLEGYLFPETYKAPYFADAKYLIKTMVSTLSVFLDSAKIERARQVDFSVKELLTFASLIEAETADRSEMKIISSVFHNRLKKNMRLQCDPTVIYALGGLDRQLLRKDLKFDSPYNTYKYKGLPPGPINSPGRDAIMASLYPDETDYLFFVADLNGKHVFTKTNAQHEKARQEIKRKRKAMKK
jgi:peptidoglycan lytic transglycosylase G